MSPETHMRLAAPFPPCARSMRRIDGQTCINGAAAEDFDEDPWMTVSPYTDRHLDRWSDATWKAMESGCSWASDYKFASMLEFGDLIALPDGVLERKFLNHVRKTVRCISRHCSRLDCECITSSPRTWGSSGKQELLDCARHCSFLEQYPLRRPGIRPQTVSYCGVRLSITGCAFARVLCAATTNKSEKLVDAVVRVSRNEVSIVAEGGRPVYRFSPLRYHAKSLLGTDVALRYNFDRWPARMVYFSDDEFDGYFLVSSEDNMKDLKAPPRQLKLSMKDIRWLWKEMGFPKAVIGNPNGKQAQVKTWREFRSKALHKTPCNHLWLLADEKGEDNINKQNAALRSYFPLVMAGKSAWELGMEFFDRWEMGRLLAPEGAKWITRKRKVRGVRPGVSHIENDKLGRKEVVYNVPVDAPQKKGKKEKELGDWFNRPVADWTRAYPFLKKRESILAEFEKQGMDASLWDGSKKLVGDASLFKECPPYMGCEDDKTIKATEKLARNKKLSADWKNKVLSVLTGSRAKSMEVALAEGVVHVLWKDTGEVTSIAPFGVDPLEAQLRVEELEKAVGTTKCHMCVLDLCEPVLKLESYGALIFTDDEAETGVVFDTATPEEDSDNEDIDIDYRPAPVFHAPGSSLAGPSTSQATQASPVLKYTPGKTPSKLTARLTPRHAAPPPFRPGSSVPLHHPSRKDDALHFEGLDHTRSSEAD
ncbi:hypothetical protein CBR_g32594 [Chara braunii]|uniref:Uncharacterized protein n=1 Tax=Chara braunii TaxID=69332 RepID=A0A388LHB6_CHABU|nr:hypothetical protein CBR_g32594 [Chara braunii]|eukprot:GBG81602.1 hypothetical protein CBR_g32594 [Chara braunii]